MRVVLVRRLRSSSTSGPLQALYDKRLVVFDRQGLSSPYPRRDDLKMTYKALVSR